MKERGIDISFYQETVDFSKVAKDVDFVILREGYRKTIDSRFLEYAAGAKKAGIKIRGVYHFSYAQTTSDAVAEAKSCLANVKKAGLGKDTIIFYDFEYDTVKKAKANGVTLGKKECIAFTKVFCEYVESQGYRAGIYSNIDYYRNMYDKSLIDKYVFWLADYTGEPDYTCAFHQYSSSGKVSGINGNVDMDYYYGTEAASVPQPSTPATPAAPTADTFINVMRSWIGFNESNGKFRQIIDLYNSVKPLPRGYAVQYNDAWCATTTSAAGIKAGCSDLVGRECSCEELISWAKKKGIWQEDGTVVPKPGWEILYNWDQTSQPNNGGADHIGVVESVNNGQITVIEGNRNDSVSRRVLSVGNGYIRGYIMCPFGQASAPAQNSTPVQNTAQETQINRTVLWEGTVNTASLNVRTWAGTEFQQIKTYPTLAQGTKVGVCDTVKDKDGDPWYFVKIGEVYGFVSAAYVTKLTSSKPSGETGSGTLSKIVKWNGKVTAGSLNVRTWAGVNNPRIKSYPMLPYITEVGVCDTVYAEDGSKWYYVRIAGKVYGFVHSAYVKKA